MANLDSSIAFSKVDITSLIIEEGGATQLTLTLTQSTLTWTRTGQGYAEVRENGQHLGTPQARLTDDGTISLSLDLAISSFKGSANVHPYEAFTHTGNASIWTTTGAGDKKMLKLIVTYNSTAGGGGSQTVTFANCIVDSVDAKEVGDGLIGMSVSMTDLENEPTIA